MVNLKNQKPTELTDRLLKNDTFDAFFLEEAEISGLISCKIHGTYTKDPAKAELLTDEELSSGFILYKRVRERLALLFENDVPVTFNITLHAGANYTNRLKENAALGDISSSIISPAVSFRLKHGELTAITGISYNTFVLSKKADEIWDKDFTTSLAALKIEFLIL